jgi:hypothetical protein
MPGSANPPASGLGARKDRGADLFGGPAPELRASLIGSQLIGLAFACYVIGVEPLAKTSPE